MILPNRKAMTGLPTFSMSPIKNFEFELKSNSESIAGQRIDLYPGS